MRRIWLAFAASLTCIQARLFAQCEDFNAPLGVLADGATFGTGGWLTAEILGGGYITIPAGGAASIWSFATGDSAMLRSTNPLPASYVVSVTYQMNFLSPAGSSNLEGLGIFDDNAWIPAPASSGISNPHTKIIIYPSWWGGLLWQMNLYNAGGWNAWWESPPGWIGGFSNTGATAALSTSYTATLTKSGGTYSFVITNSVGATVSGPGSISVAAVDGSAYGDYLVIGDLYTDYNYGQMAVEQICLMDLSAVSPTGSPSPTRTPCPTRTPTLTPSMVLTPTRTPSQTVTPTLTPTPDLYPDGFFVSRNAFRPSEPQTLDITISAELSGTYAIVIYNSVGELVRSLYKEKRSWSSLIQASWDGRNDFGDPAASGVYLIHAETPRWARVRRVAVLR